MAQPSTNESTNITVEAAKYMQQYQNLAQQQSQQQNLLSTNQRSTQLLQNNLLINTNNNNTNNNNNDDESKNDLKQMEHAMESISIRQGGIDDVTQGDVTIIENNKQLYQSLKHESFSAMKNILRPELLDGCDKMNFVHPSKIQAEAIPRCLNNNNNLYPNFIGQAHHGSGKTATFTLIMLQRIDENISKLQGLVIVHSRELAIQTYNVFNSLGQFMSDLKILLALKGENILLNQWNYQICIGTPGTIIHKIFNAQKRSNIGLKGFLNHFKVLVVDEADEFLKGEKQYKNRKSKNNKKKKNDFGNLFSQLTMIINDINNNINAKYQTLLFSATYPPSIKHLATEIAPNAIIIKIAKKNVQLDNIKIFRIICESEIDKFNTLLRVISLSNIGQMIIFVNTIVKAKQLIDGLERNSEIGIACSALYGRGMDIKIRDKTMEQFRKNQTQCLIASNVIARGIDVPAVGLVVNFEIPKNNNKFDSETFMHRVGRTGRFGNKGICINLINNNNNNLENNILNNIINEYQLKINTINKTAKDIKSQIANWIQND